MVGAGYVHGMFMACAWVVMLGDVVWGVEIISEVKDRGRCIEHRTSRILGKVRLL